MRCRHLPLRGVGRPAAIDAYQLPPEARRPVRRSCPTAATPAGIRTRIDRIRGTCRPRPGPGAPGVPVRRPGPWIQGCRGAAAGLPGASTPRTPGWSSRASPTGGRPARRCEREAARNPRVVLALEVIPDDRMQVYLRAADAVVLPVPRCPDVGFRDPGHDLRPAGHRTGHRLPAGVPRHTRARCCTTRPTRRAWRERSALR